MGDFPSFAGQFIGCLKTERLGVEIKALLHIPDPYARGNRVDFACFHGTILLTDEVGEDQWLTIVTEGLEKQRKWTEIEVGLRFALFVGTTPVSLKEPRR